MPVEMITPPQAPPPLAPYSSATKGNGMIFVAGTLAMDPEGRVIGVGDARAMFNYQQAHAPLRRTVTLDEVGGAAVYLLSPLSGGVTGEIHYVDSGYNVLGMTGI